mmetsp:Transcript_56193/g.93643  ORF Transcript_56193/g.93643 Transcript_56193/m.93643 type:complete len:266 (-) Transcript_56193:60-857(-)
MATLAKASNILRFIWQTHHKFHRSKPRVNYHKSWVLCVSGVAICPFYMKRHIVCAESEDANALMAEYHLKARDYLQAEKYDELIDFLWTELRRIYNSANRDSNIVHFLENKLCSELCSNGRANEAIQIIAKYSEQELIETKSLLTAAFVYHAAEQFERAIHLYDKMVQDIDHQLADKVPKSRASMAKTEILFTVQMHLAQCYTSLDRIEQAKEVYADMNINDILRYGAAEIISGWFEKYTPKEDAEKFQSFIELHKQHNPQLKAT